LNFDPSLSTWFPGSLLLLELQDNFSILVVLNNCKMSDTEADPDALQEMHGTGALVDIDTSNLFAVGALDFGVEPDVSATAGAQETGTDAPTQPNPKKRRTNSIAHEAIIAKKLVLILIDLETGGENVGIIQMSAIAHDHATNCRFGEPFNEYVKLPKNVSASWIVSFPAAQCGCHSS
jgi:hypothetical protein